tara:strand:- start:265 stop:369 length:105 start_codon:yes stop_codon:yes gene_type:complete
MLGLKVSLNCVRTHDDVVARLTHPSLGTSGEILD